MTLNAQNLKTLTLDDLLPGGGNYKKYQPEMPAQMQWKGDDLVRVEGDSVIRIKDSKVLVTRKGLNSELKKIGKEEVKSFSNVAFLSDNVFQVKDDKQICLYGLSKGDLVEVVYILPDKSQNIELSASKMNLAYTKGNSLYVLDAKGVERLVSEDKDSTIVFGQAVHRNEFGIEKGVFWSPKGNLLAFYRMDEAKVTDYPLVDISARTAKLKNIKYPMAGMKSHYVTVGVYNVSTGKTVYLKTGTPKEKYLTNIAWSPDESSIYISELNRGQDSCALKQYNVQSGKLEKVLFEETHPKYIEPQTPILFLPNNPSQFLWESKKDGFNHIYLYDVSGRCLKQVTSGNWEVISVMGFDEKGENVYLLSTEQSPIEKHIYEVNIETGKRIKLSTEEGVHKAVPSPSRKYMYDQYTSQHNAGEIAIVDLTTKKSERVYAAKNPHENSNMPEISLGTLKANDGKTDLYYRLVKPTNFDSSKKYSTIVYVYGGPHSQLVDNSWLGQARGWDIYMAQKGYVVFTLDNRGTLSRGIDFENITHRQLGVVETEDQMTGVEFLKSLSYVDTDRMGVHGWSYGGFMTLNLMLRHPETFKVGVAGGPVTDWKYYEIMYGERYMDSPQENPEGYEETSMLNKAGNLKGRLLLIHGDEDPTVVMQHSLQFLKASIKAGTHPDFFVYPGHGHNMTGADRIHLHEHITRYFEDFMK